MPENDVEQTEATEETQVEQTEDQKVEPAESKEEEKQEESTDTGEDDPEKLRSIVADVRKEAASYRVKLRETKELLEKAVSPDDVEKIKTSLSEKITDLEKQVIAKEFALPDVLLKAITPGTEEEMRAQAKEFAAVIKTPTPRRNENPSGGLNPGEDDEISPLEAAKRYRAAQRQF